MSEFFGFLADLARVALVMAATAALLVAATRPEPIWTVIAVLALCAAVTASRQPSPGAAGPNPAPGGSPTQ